jgi:hypothetical protein
MKHVSLVRNSLVGIACFSLVLTTTAGASEKKSRLADNRQDSKNVYQPAPKERVVLVYVTGSRIPQRVVLHGQQADSGSPLYVVQGDELHRRGATSIYGMIALDPSVGISRR